MESTMLIGGGLLILAGLASVLSLPKVFSEARRDDLEAIRTTGRVIEVREVPPIPGGDDDPTWHPVVRFEDQQGNEHTFRARYGKFVPKWEPGDSIDVAYPPSRPEGARIDNRFMAYQSVIIALLFAFVFLGSGTLLVLLAFFHDS